MKSNTVKLNKDFFSINNFEITLICNDNKFDDKTVVFPNGYNLEPNKSFNIVFVNGHSKDNDDSNMTLNNIPIVVNRYGILTPIPNHNILDDIYDTLQSGTSLEMYYTNNYNGNNNPAFVVIGNPVVLYTNSYIIYADGKKIMSNEAIKQYITDQDELSDFEDTTISTTNTTADYDGFITFSFKSFGSSKPCFYINNLKMYVFYGLPILLGEISFYVKKGDTWKRDSSEDILDIYYPRARWYKKRDYSNRI